MESLPPPVSFQGYWKDDFNPLQSSGKLILKALRQDEEAPDADLYRRITTSSSSSSSQQQQTSASTTNNNTEASYSSHLYIHEGNANNNAMTIDDKENNTNSSHKPSVQVRHEKSLPLPAFLVQQIQRTKVCSYMGLFPEAELGWLTIDDTVYLWKTTSSTSSSATVGVGSIPTTNSSSSATVMEDFLSFTVPTHRPITAVGLVAPKKGVFKEIVEWCLVVTTPDEAVLCALARTSTTTTQPSSSSPLRLIPTRYVIPSDWVMFLSVCGTKDGRIFLGGADGCLYEMDYQGLMPYEQTDQQLGGAKQEHQDINGQLEEFYDGKSSSCPPVLVEQANTTYSNTSTTTSILKHGKRLISSVTTMPQYTANSYDRPRKCRKLNHSQSSFAASVFPEFMMHAASMVFGGDAGKTTTGGGPIEKMVVDEERQVLYTLSSRGWICTLDISSNSVRLAAVMNTPKTARLYLEAVSRGKIYPPSSSSSSSFNDGIITFPGGGTSAQAGVGGMDGARTILKLAEASSSSGRRRQVRRRTTATNRGGNNGAGSGASAMNGTESTNNRNSRFAKQENILAPVDIYVVPRRESARLTLVAVTSAGLRYYISSLSPIILSNGPSRKFFGTRRKSDPLAPYSKLSFCHIRAPPPLVSLQQQTQQTATNGFVVPQMASTLDKLSRVDASWYRLGVFILALKSTSSSNEESSRVVGNIILTACPDSVARLKESTKSNDASSTSTVQKYVAPGGICEVLSLPMSAAVSYTYNGSGGTFASATMENTYSGQNQNSPMSNTPMLVPGGRVWDISSTVGSESSTILSLLLNSKTPTDAELRNVGMVHAYFPPSKVRSSNERTTTANNRLNGSNNNSAQMVTWSQSNTASSSSSSSNSISSVAFNVFINMLLQRPVTHGIELSSRAIESDDRSPRMVYRLSSRTGSALGGFSLTAGEKEQKTVVNGTANRTLTSARLSPWLLQPDVVPLNPLAIQHVIPSSQMVALNVGGLHYFGVQSVLTSLANTILSAGVNVDKDESITNFFTSYGYAEGCAMCLFLAIGCCGKGGSRQYGGGTSGSGGLGLVMMDQDELKQRAYRAALARACRPTLETLSSASSSSETSAATSSPSSAATSKDDPWIPEGYKFKPSALCESLGIVLARLLRPIWHKPAVVVTEGRVIRGASGGGLRSRTRTTPAKVELLLDDTVLQEIRQPLYFLQNLMKELFPPAIDKVPGLVNSHTTTTNTATSMDIDENMDGALSGQEHYLTRAMEYQVHTRTIAATNANSSKGIPQLRPSDIERIAQLTEERIIHSHYRLLSRTVQLLSLLSQLKRAQSMAELPEVEWGLLHGISVSQLVQTRAGQERLESVLNTLVTSSSPLSTSSATGDHKSAPMAPFSAEANELANIFTKQCNQFFSPGSHFAYLGFRSAKEALAFPPNSSRRLVRVQEAVKFLTKAAQYWHSPQVITGQILQNSADHKERVAYDQLALRALRYDSPLAKGVSLLIELGHTAGAVDLCLITASNFSSSKSKTNALVMVDEGYPNNPNLHFWEKGLYHKQRFQTSNDKTSSSSDGGGDNGTGSNNNDDRSSGTISVTAKDAINTCYALVFSNLSKLLNGPTRQEIEKGEDMVSKCVSASDKDFLHAFFNHLLESNCKDVLLRINSRDLEQWLEDQEKKSQIQQPSTTAVTVDTDLLYKYYKFQQKYVKAGEVAWKRATATSNDRQKYHLHDRIEYLIRANQSYSDAMKQANSPRNANLITSGASSYNTASEQQELPQSKKHVEDTLGVARLQSQVLQEVSKPGFNFTLEDDSSYNLNYTLVSLSDLYNQYCSRFYLYDICLYVLHFGRHNDTTHIEQIWKSLFVEQLVPCYTRKEQVFQFMRAFVRDSQVEDPEVTFLQDHDITSSSSVELFETGTSWRKQLEGRIVRLGKDLYGSGADFVFPIDLIASYLQGLQRLYASSISSSTFQNDTDEQKAWPFSILVSVGVPYLAALDACERSLEQQDEDHQLLLGVGGGVGGTSMEPQRRLEHVKTMIVLLELWITKAQVVSTSSNTTQATMNPPATALQQLSNALASGSLRQRIDNYKAQLHALHGNVQPLEHRLSDVENALKEFFFN